MGRRPPSWFGSSFPPSFRRLRRRSWTARMARLLVCPTFLPAAWAGIQLGSAVLTVGPHSGHTPVTFQDRVHSRASVAGALDLRLDETPVRLRGSKRGQRSELRARRQGARGAPCPQRHRTGLRRGQHRPDGSGRRRGGGGGGGGGVRGSPRGAK